MRAYQLIISYFVFQPLFFGSALQADENIRKIPTILHCVSQSDGEYSYEAGIIKNTTGETSYRALFVKTDSTTLKSKIFANIPVSKHANASYEKYFDATGSTEIRRDKKSKEFVNSFMKFMDQGELQNLDEVNCTADGSLSVNQ